MYSYEDRLRAVQLFFKPSQAPGLDHSPAGYPRKNALKTCFREYEQRRLGAKWARLGYKCKKANLTAGFCGDLSR
jgi:hypothetical protein